MNPVHAQFTNVRQRTEALCAPLQPADYIPQPVVFVSPPKWHLAHTTWFFEEFVLKKFIPDYQVYNPQFGHLFNSYYNTIGERTARQDRGSITRPGVEEVYNYRHHVTEKVLNFIREGASQKVLDIIQLGMNHEQQHQELLLMDLKYILSLHPFHPVYVEDNVFHLQTNAEDGWLAINEGLYEIGHKSDDFCFDNEMKRHKVFLQEFEISKSLVTNGEYLEFMENGGYQNFRFWLDDGWAWIQENQISHPLYWNNTDGRWQHFTLAGLQPLQADALLSHLSYYEADAFARWKGMRLPTEFEWEAAAPELKWEQLWEHTASAYLPYPGFCAPDGAVGEYNGKFMVNQMVLRGASLATPARHSRITYRNFFHPPLRWHFSGIRLAR